MATNHIKPRPRPTPTSQPFWDALRAERIDLQRCDECGSWVHYPRSRCSTCLSARLSWHTVDGSGHVYTFSVSRQPTAPPFADEVPQIIAVVELANGVRVTTTLVDVEPDDVRVGMAVQPVFEHGDDGITMLRYRPVTTQEQTTSPTG
ncbi:MAG TPA: Zn-ribbon domain-containing OB-fold protein [Acidimicrobiales bacterium]